MGKLVNWISNHAGGFFSGLASAYGTWQNARNVDKQLKAQSIENANTREHNLNLAKQQNQWNIDMWNRQNAYNTPAAQRARLEAAGLNADMMYGQGGVQNTATSAPDMTAGAPGTPMDWTALGSRPTIGQGISAALETSLAHAQINRIKAETQKTLADAGLSEIALTYADAKEKLGMKLSEEQFKVAEQTWKNLAQTIENNKELLNGIKIDNALKALDKAFKEKTNDVLAEKLSNELKITKAEAENALRYFVARTLGIEAENAWSGAKWIVEQKEGTGILIKYGGEFAQTILSTLLGKLVGKKPGLGGITINNNLPAGE